MGKRHEIINPELREWIAQQKVFFVATAPLTREGHVNCSPKGGDTFRILGDREVAYLDLTGSGVETLSHLQENGRIVIMFCAFTGAPKIVRLHGTGSVLYPADDGYPMLAQLFPALPGMRAIIRVTVNRVSDSCGYGVPQFDFVAPRETLTQWSVRKGESGLAAYRREKNASSVDGLPGYSQP